MHGEKTVCEAIPDETAIPVWLLLGCEQGRKRMKADGLIGCDITAVGGDLLTTEVEGRLGDKAGPVVVMCAGGVRSAFAARTLGELGYTDVVSMAGGFNRWKDEGRNWRVPEVLNPEQRNRYSRHLLLPEVGEEGQQKLLGAKVLLLGIELPVNYGPQYRDGLRKVYQDAAKRHGVALVPGAFFYKGPSEPVVDLVRAALARPHAQIVEAVSRMNAFASTLTR